MNFEEEGIALIKANVKAVVDNPDDVEVKAASTSATTIFEVSVAKSDIGQVVGREGKTASAIRRILYSFANKSKKNAVMEIID